MIRAIAVIIILSLVVSCNRPKDEISLSGKWTLSLDSISDPDNTYPQLLDYNLSVTLPSTLDSAGIGTSIHVEPRLKREVMLHLRRKVSYIGPAYYRKEIVIPLSWEGRHISLKLDRVLWESVVWIDGRKAGNNNSLSTPHYYDLSAYLTPGKHTITICIDNSRKFVLNRNDLAHAYTEETQIKWNGILGEISLRAGNAAHISGLAVYPDYAGKSLAGEVKSILTGKDPYNLKVQVVDGNNSIIGNTMTAVTGDNTRFQLNLSCELKPWDEFSPCLYKVVVSLLDKEQNIKDVRTDRFGFRDLEARDRKFYLNGKQIFLRGTLECCIFPLTGHPPTDQGSWEKVLITAREYGLNHLRFHSWCPPEAAFEAADKVGMYLQVELPNWSLDFGTDMALVDFIYGEADKIITEYGNHPSFLLMSMGNELEGNFDFLTGLVTKLKNRDRRHLYTTTTYSFQKGHGLSPEPVDDYYITQNTEKGWVRGQGVFDQFIPDFKTDYTKFIDHLTIPVVSHEIGQYTVFPDIREIEEYRGVLSPVNFMAVKNDLENKGLTGIAEKYTQATGKFATLLYKEEIERALKTLGLGGFQLLDLHDFPGQGTALVGILNAFWKLKGFVSSKEWRMFCSEVVPLLWYEKAVCTTDETFSAEFGLANYYKDFNNVSLHWKISGNNGITIRADSIRIVKILKGSTSKLGGISLPLAGFSTPAKYTIEVSLEGSIYKNQWNIWVYSKSIEMPDSGILATNSFNEAINALKNGQKVFLNPDIQDINGITGKFVPVFWSPVHFPDQPGTMGILVDPKHAAFRNFPTDIHSNWQWWDLCKNSKTFLLDSLVVDPIVTVIDNFFKNRRLGNIFEAKVGEGKLIFTSIDLHSSLESRPVARQLKYSLLKYMNSADFNPSSSIKAEEILSLYSKPNYH
ncbi:MAG: glycoside hydrolase family 2 [Porphyromonadaceae bacterium]|nr:MAG: glycoside hydrolase family 2 [Porphyromonadaceae bacterium]